MESTIGDSFPMTRWTLIRHTGYSVGGKPAFEHAVEERQIHIKEAVRVTRAGGVVTDNYLDAHDRAFRENYPRKTKGLIPRAPGKFVKVKGLEEEVYVPA